MLLFAGSQEVIEDYLVTEKAAAGLEQEARPILHNFTGELTQRYEAKQGGLLLIGSGSNPGPR
jgi:hypothetical protein